MELRSTENPDTSNPVTMSMLEYLRKKGIEAMSGICKYPESVCPHMTVLKGKSYCDATPCQLTGELPKRTNADRIRSMSDEELATLFLFFVPTNFDRAMYTGISGKYTRTSEETFDNNLKWLKQPVED